MNFILEHYFYTSLVLKFFSTVYNFTNTGNRGTMGQFLSFLLSFDCFSS